MAAGDDIGGKARIFIENPSGDQRVLVPTIHTDEIGSDTPGVRPRLDVVQGRGAKTAQTTNPTPATTRPYRPVPAHRVPQNGFVIVSFQADTKAEQIDSDHANAEMKIGVVKRDLTQIGTNLEFRVDELDQGDSRRDTDRVADDATLTTTDFTEISAWKIPTGQEVMVHGDSKVQPVEAA